MRMTKRDKKVARHVLEEVLSFSKELDDSNLFRADVIYTFEVEVLREKYL